MVRKSEYGSFTFSAGEIGEYVVCPEAWRLKMVEGIRTEKREDSRLGAELHQRWAEDCDETLFLSRGVKVTATLIICAIVFFLFSRM